MISLESACFSGEPRGRNLHVLLVFWGGCEFRDATEIRGIRRKNRQWSLVIRVELASSPGTGVNKSRYQKEQLLSVASKNTLRCRCRCRTTTRIRTKYVTWVALPVGPSFRRFQSALGQGRPRQPRRCRGRIIPATRLAF